MLNIRQMYIFVGASLASLFVAVSLDDLLMPSKAITWPVVQLFSLIPALVLAAAILFYFIFMYKSQRIAALLTLMMSITIFTAHLLKLIFSRSRPNPIYHNYSFPSAHATFVFALVPFAFMYSRKFGYSYLAFAVLVSISRILLRAHYLSDVVSGGILGFSISWIFMNLLSENKGRFDEAASLEKKSLSA